MIYIKINDTRYPATVSGKVSDTAWDNRASKAITLDMDYATASALFVDGLAWSIVHEQEVPIYERDENGQVVLDIDGDPKQTGTEMQEIEYDNADYCIAGDITDHRDGTITVNMGKLTDLEEAYEIMLGGNV